MAAKTAEEMLNDPRRQTVQPKPQSSMGSSPRSHPQANQSLQVPNGLGDVLAQSDRLSNERSEAMRAQAATARKQQQMISIAVNYSDEQLEAELAYMIQGRQAIMEYGEFAQFVSQAAESDRLLTETIEVLASIQSNELKLAMQQNALLTVFQGIMQGYRTNMAPAPMPALMVSENVPLLTSAH